MLAAWRGPDGRHGCWRKRTKSHGPLRFSDGSWLWPDSWLAVKTTDNLAVQAALSLHNPRPCSWLEGLTNADQLFIAPPVKGWVLVTGAGLPQPWDDVDGCFRFLLGLSRKLGSVQFFSANQISQHHAWVRVKRGRIQRAYAWAGTTVWQQGDPTRWEVNLGLKCFEYGELHPGLPLQEPQVIEANVAKVPLLAAAWGVDPALIQQHFLLQESGIAGRAAIRY